jgi:hypothetical protein
MREIKFNERIFIAILAGNKKQFDDFIRQKPIIEDNCEYIYISSPDNARGIRFFDYKVIGTFWDRDDAGKLEEAIKDRIN